MEGIKNTALTSSAGAGKTFALTKRFLRLLFEAQDCPLKSLYGITFTNEAAFEMKQRIIRYLDTLINEPGNPTPDEKEIIQFFNHSLPDIKKRARKKRHLLLNNMSDFNISTFHSLFSSFLSSIPFSAGILPGFKIIDDIQEAILFEDTLNKFFEIAIGDTRIYEFINHLPDNKGTDVKYEIQRYYRELKPWLGFLEDLIKNEDRVKQKLQECEEELFSAIDSFRNFVIENKSCGYTKKGYLNKNFESFLNCLDAFKQDKDILRLKDSLLKFNLKSKSYMQKFMKNLGMREIEFVNLLEKLYENTEKYLSALSDYHILLYLKPIIELHNLFQKEKQRQNILSFEDIEQYTLTALKNAPEPDYLYFKIGAEIRHLLIDEFQDTSHRQLAVLDPIINEITSVSPEEKSFFYVGDPHQAIYRWRGGAPELFDYVVDRYKGKIEKERLKINHRCKKEIIDFVNLLLEKNDEADPDKTGGWIRVCDLGTFDNTKEGFERVREETCTIIKKLYKEYGYNYSDIAVLVRKNKRGSRIAQDLIHHNIPCVSRSQAYIIYDNDIQFIFNLLQFLDDPENDFALLNILLAPAVNLKEETIRYLRGRRKSLYLGLCDLHPDWEIAKKLKDLLASVQLCNPYELIHRCIRIFKIPLSYSIATLFDITLNYIQENGNNLSAFISWFKQAGKKIEIREFHTEGVNVLTVHKAKGLEFEVVILPDTHWSLEQGKRDEILFSYKDKGAVPDRIYLRKYGKYIKGLVDEEKQREIKDHLNLFYVALTRAKTGIYILGFSGKKSKGFWIDRIEEKLGKVEYSKGIIKKIEKPKFEKPRPYYEPKEGKPGYIREERTLYSPTERGIEIIAPERRKSMEFGTMIHTALSKIEWLDGLELKSEIERLVTIIKNEYAHTRKEAEQIEKELTLFLEKIFTDRRFHSLFYKEGRTITCKNELPIYFQDGQRDVVAHIDRLLIEPEKITIIDYKTGPEKAEYKHQMAVYKKGLEKIYPEKEVVTKLVFLENPEVSG